MDVPPLKCPNGCAPTTGYGVMGTMAKCGACGCEFQVPGGPLEVSVMEAPSWTIPLPPTWEPPPVDLQYLEHRSIIPEDYDPNRDDDEFRRRPKPKPASLGEPAEWAPSPDQVKARDGIMAWQKNNDGIEVLTVGGWAGTGKTALTGRVAYDFIKEGVTVAFATPTGKAAQVLKKALARGGVLDAPVTTIHGLVYKPVEDPKTGRVIRWEPRRELDCDLVVVDEASMVSQDVLKTLRSFGVPILAVGDHGQLPPVGESTGLMTNPDFRLEKIHRQAAGNPIIRLSTLIRNGAPNEALKAFIDDIDDPRVRYTKNRTQAIEFGAPPGALITYTNKLRTALNRDIRHDKFGYTDDIDPQPGEVVICLKNKRLDDGRLMANGLRGTVKSCAPGQQHTYKMTVEFDEPVGLVEDIDVCTHQFLRDKTFAGFDEVPGKHSSWWSVGALLDFGER